MRENRKILIVIMIIIIILILLIGGYLIYINTSNNMQPNIKEDKKVIELDYTEDDIPGSRYVVTIYENRKMDTMEYNFSSAVGQGTSTEKNSTVLTIEEYEKASKIHDYIKGVENNQVGAYFASALCSISREDEILTTEDELSFKFYIDDDLNNDGKVTRREFGNSWLDILIDEHDI